MSHDSASTLAPWDLVLEARRQSLDAIALTGHNQAGTAWWGRWFSQLVGGPTVIVGEEIHTPHYHMIAAGIQSTISWRDTAAQSIAEIHRQGGVAIAAHPTQFSWPAFDPVIAGLYGAEVMQPVVWGYCWVWCHCPQGSFGRRSKILSIYFPSRRFLL